MIGRGPKNDRLPTVRLMTPFSMRCTRCGTFIPKAKKFNARKAVPASEKYLGIQKFRFYFRCPECSGEISFITDPKNMDYVAESGAQRNFEVWREGHVEETDEERLQRLEEEEADVDPMKDLEAKMVDAQKEMAVSDALDEIRAANARNEKAAEFGEMAVVKQVKDDALERQEAEDAEAARRAFQDLSGEKVHRLSVEPEGEAASDTNNLAMKAQVPAFRRVVKPKKNFSALLGIKRKGVF